MAGALQHANYGRRKNKRRSAAPMSEINVTPFVDVMLVLLIIFMVTAPLMATGIKVNLPDSSVSQLQSEEKDEPITVLVDKKGTLYIKDLKVSYEQLAAKLGEVTKQNKENHIFVRGDKDASYGEIMKAISAINEAGFTKVGLVTQQKSNL